MARRKNMDELGGTVPLIGYAPDMDSRIPGVLTNCAAMVPSTKGMKGAPSAQNLSLPALAAACQGSAVVRKLDNTTRFYAGTGTKLYEAATSSWTDRTRAAGGDYAAGTDIRWRFAQFGDVSLAAVKSDILQASSSGAFANAAATAPKASIVETFENFVLLCDVNDQGALYDSADRPNGWWVAARGGHTDWTPSIANQCATGILTSSPGPIRAARRFGQGCVIYKERGMYVMTYVGQPNIIDVQEIPGNVGAPSQEAVVVVGTPEDPRHIFMGFDDFYSFDGSRPIPIGSPLKETVFNELNKNYSYACTALHDSINSRIYFFYPTSNSINPDKCVVYHYKTGRWGRDDRTIEAVAEYITAGLTYGDLGSSYSTYGDLPNLSYGSSFWTAGFPVPAIFNSSHRIQTLDGNTGTSSITNGDLGSDSFVTFVSRVTPAFLTRPSSATLTNYQKASLGNSYTQDATTSMDANGRFDFMRAAKWHRFTLEFSGNVEIPSLDIDAKWAGEQ
jgi:hypothetical protein